MNNLDHKKRRALLVVFYLAFINKKFYVAAAKYRYRKTWPISKSFWKEGRGAGEGRNPFFKKGFSPPLQNNLTN